MRAATNLEKAHEAFSQLVTCEKIEAIMAGLIVSDSINQHVRFLSQIPEEARSVIFMAAAMKLTETLEKKRAEDRQ